MYMWKLYYDGGWLCDSHVDSCFEEKPFYEDEDEALEEANDKIQSYIDYWESDGCEYDRDLFDIEIVEV